jgi:hypothetical protein
MNKVYVKTDGPVPEYLTAGKVYAVDGDEEAGWITFDNGDIEFIYVKACSWLKERPWTLCDQHGNPLPVQSNPVAETATRPPDISVVTAEGMAQIKAAFGPDWKALAGELAEAAKLAECALAFIYGGEPLDPSGAIAAMRTALAKYEQEKEKGV